MSLIEEIISRLDNLKKKMKEQEEKIDNIAVGVEYLTEELEFYKVYYKYNKYKEVLGDSPD